MKFEPWVATGLVRAHRLLDVVLVIIIAGIRVCRLCGVNACCKGTRDGDHTMPDDSQTCLACSYSIFAVAG